MKKVIFVFVIILMYNFSFGQGARLGMQLKLVGTWKVDSVKPVSHHDNSKFEAMQDDVQIEFDKISYTVQFTGKYEVIVTITNKANANQKVVNKYHWEIKDEVYKEFDKEKNENVKTKPIPTLFVTGGENNYTQKLKIIDLSRKKMILQGGNFIFGGLKSEIIMEKL